MENASGAEVRGFYDGLGQVAECESGIARLPPGIAHYPLASREMGKMVGEICRGIKPEGKVVPFEKHG